MKQIDWNFKTKTIIIHPTEWLGCCKWIYASDISHLSIENNINWQEKSPASTIWMRTSSVSFVKKISCNTVTQKF